MPGEMQTIMFTELTIMFTLLQCRIVVCSWYRIMVFVLHYDYKMLSSTALLVFRPACSVAILHVVCGTHPCFSLCAFIRT